MSVALASRRSMKSVLLWAALGVCLALLAASVLLHDTLFHGRALLAASSSSPPPAGPEAPAAPGMVTTVTLPEGKWKTAGVQTETAKVVAVDSEIEVSGRIEANSDQRVEIRPRASGVVREVHARFGQKVKKGDLLAVLDSPDIGTARLNLRGRQIELATARTELDWKHEVATNVAKLIPEIRKGVPATTIQNEYANRPLGSDRALLLRAYTDFEIASHEAEKQTGLYKDKIIGEHPYVLAAHTFEGAQANLSGVLEQVTFDAKHEQTLAEQKVRLAEAAVIDAAQRLRILGVEVDIPQLLAHAGDAAASMSSTNEDVTAYAMTAPFDGTILTKNAVPSQKADSGDVLFTLADLKTVWVTANITESHLGVLPAIRDGVIRLTAVAYPGKTFQAKLLTVGSLVDPTTRTVPLVAETENPDGLLKIGMFVRIILDSPRKEELLTIPTASVVEIEGEKGVFVPSGTGDRTFTFHPVQLGREAGQRLVVAGGLKKGDTVVSSGAFYLKSELILQNDTEEE